MRIHTTLIYQMTNVIGEYILLREEGYEYSGPVALSKGDSTAKAAEQQQAAFNTQLMDTFKQQYAKQSQVLDFLKGKLQPMIDSPTGYDSTTLNAMRTTASDNLSTSYTHAGEALQNHQFATGSRDLPSGVNEQQTGALTSAEAADKANAQNTITMNDANLKQTNYWNAMNVLSGNVASQFNPLGYANSATSGAGAVAGLSQAYTASAGPGIASILGGVAGGVTSAAGQAGGFGALFGKGCWIAAAVFDGWDDPRTGTVRSYLWNTFNKTWYGKPTMSLYMTFGEQLSKIPLVVRVLTPLFELALDRATT
jgi:hypothetical protein